MHLPVGLALVLTGDPVAHSASLLLANAQKSAAAQLGRVTAHGVGRHPHPVDKILHVRPVVTFHMSQDLKPPEIGEGGGRVEDPRVKRGLPALVRTIADF